VSASESFLSITSRLLKSRVYGESVNYNVDCVPTESALWNDDQDRKLIQAFDKVWYDRTAFKYGVEVPWSDWLLESGFPVSLYSDLGEDLWALVDKLGRSKYHMGKYGKDSDHSFFSSLCRPLASGKSFMQYFLDRFCNRRFRSHPNFYFDLVPAEWIWEELIRNPKQIKTARAAKFCCTNIFFRWIPEEERLLVGWIMKHVMWSHFLQDVYSPRNMAFAIAKDLGIDRIAVSVYVVSAAMDSAKRAKEITGLIGGQVVS